MSYQEFKPMRFQILPPVVKNLLIINGILYLATVVLENKLGYDLAETLGLRFPSSEYFRPYQYITHLFMHGSFMHLFSNMLALWMFGNMLENFWGPKKFLIFFLVTGLGAAVIHTLFTWYEIEQMHSTINTFLMQVNPVDFKLLVSKYSSYIEHDQYTELNKFYDLWQQAPNDPGYINEARSFTDVLLKNKTDIPTIGASGAVFGILLAFGMTFPNTIIYLYFAIPIKAKWFVLFYGLFEVYLGIQNNPGDNVAHFAHLGGMLFGYFLIRAWGKNQFRRFD
jgi:membrane associated rhomboid family serine protease